MSAASERVQKMFEDAVKANLKKMVRADEAFIKEEMVTYIFNTAHWLFSTPADQVGEDELLRVGGHLTGAYAYFGNRAAMARAERDLYLQKRDDIKDQLISEYTDDDYKVTKARTEASKEIADSGINEQVTEKELTKNDWEYLMNATDKMISFIQTTLSYRKSEKFRSNSMQN
tara:strand:- start:972 stop:1490 length:519 start_codon:yes stop_codon:yes gene_type:complete